MYILNEALFLGAERLALNFLKGKMLAALLKETPKTASLLLFLGQKSQSACTP